MSSLPPVTVIHGDALLQSRQFFHQLFTQTPAQTETVRFEGKDLDLTALVQACQSTSLIALNRLIIIENLFHPSAKAKLATTSAYCRELIQGTTAYPLVIYEPRLLTPAQLKLVQGASVKSFKTPPVVFQFLANLAPQKQAQFIPLYQRSLKKQPAELLLAMIARQIRLLIQLADPDLHLPPWQMAKLSAQRRRFTDEQLTAFHDQLVLLDRRAKQGQITGSLGQELAMLLLKL